MNFLETIASNFQIVEDLREFSVLFNVKIKPKVFEEGHAKILKIFPHDFEWIYRTFWTKGVKIVEHALKNRKPHGILRTWYDNGTPSRIERYSNGVLNGQNLM